MVGDPLPRVPPRPFKYIQKVIIDKFITTLSSCSKASADKAAVDLSVEVIEKFEEYWSQYGDCPLKGRNGILKGICPQVRRRADFHLRWYLQNLKILYICLHETCPCVSNQASSFYNIRSRLVLAALFVGTLFVTQVL